MAVKVIEFDDEGLGCTKCPYCRKDNCNDFSVDSSSYKFGFYCTKNVPAKWLAYGSNGTKKGISTPNWCTLKPIETVVKPYEPRFAEPIKCEINYKPFDSKKLFARITIPRYVTVASDFKKLEEMAKKEVAYSLVQTKEFQDALKYRTIAYTDLADIIVEGEIEIVTKHHD